MTRQMIEAVAEAWASIDGKAEQFACERLLPADHQLRKSACYYDGYMIDAEELLKRVEARGYRLAGIEAPRP